MDVDVRAGLERGEVLGFLDLDYGAILLEDRAVEVVYGLDGPFG
ncbi:hypothetical protein [Streptomyces sp. NPDC088350]